MPLFLLSAQQMILFSIKNLYFCTLIIRQTKQTQPNSIMRRKREYIPSSASFADSKPHFEILDGLRGAAALMVVWYHVFEGFAFAGGTAIDTFNHGHLAVDFFFMLSGFVISYAYDDRWKPYFFFHRKSLTLGSFFKRRLIRLHPMIVMGAVIGVITFLIQGGVKWDGTETPMPWVFIAMLLTMLFIPAYPGANYDVRGNGEMYSLNGPAWSLFFEYIGNIIYALFIRRISYRALALLVIVTGCAWSCFAISNISGYDMLGVGWTLDVVNFCGGLLRMLFPFTLGMLMARSHNPISIPGIFWISIAILFGLFSLPFIPATIVDPAPTISFNSAFELFAIIFVFPLIIWFSAGGNLTNTFSRRVCKFLGDLSYPLYVVHYPVMYLFYAWLIQTEQYTLAETWPVVLIVFSINIILAYLCLKLYDEPIRRWLAKTFIK